MTKISRHGVFRGKPCVVPSCKHYSFDKDVKFFPIPRDLVARDEFRRLCGIHHFQKQSAICSDHFTPEDFSESGTLLRSARPSLNLINSNSDALTTITESGLSRDSRRRAASKQGSICAVLGCNKYAGDRKAENLHFFKCPQKPAPEAPEEQRDLYNKWFSACSRLDLTEFANHHRVCSRHFDDADIDQHPHVCRTRLRPGSYPKKFLGKLKHPSMGKDSHTAPPAPTPSVPIISHAVIEEAEKIEEIHDHQQNPEHPVDEPVVIQTATVEETPVVQVEEMADVNKDDDVAGTEAIEEIVPSDIWNSVISDGFQAPVADDGGTAWNVYQRDADHIVFARIRPVLISHAAPLYYSSTVDFVRINRDLSVVLSSGNRVIPSQVVSSYFAEASLSAGGPVLSPFLYNFAAFDGIIFKSKK
ncbi:uncharacterized protein LOC129583908 [Paramacrobiotus metropolitanus]|uniref:uncharacterized protein LOC129583908 n=1 Tax=Paramacrobiotus metropolitanus TaxID=2943436 RepID=UPI002445966E|nr:uncharacterized protein LOC129583908 [Paramacrobiotus metropolitanus]